MEEQQFEIIQRNGHQALLDYLEELKDDGNKVDFVTILDEYKVLIGYTEIKPEFGHA